MADDVIEFVKSLGADPVDYDAFQARMKTIQSRMVGILEVAERSGSGRLTKAQQQDFEVLEREFDRVADLQHRFLQRVNTNPIVNPNYAPGGSRSGGNRMNVELTEQDKVFADYLRGQASEAELRAQGVGTGSAGGYLVPAGFRQTITETRKAFGAVRRVAEVIETDSGESLPWPTNDDTANLGALLAENTQATEQDFLLGTKQLGAYKYTSKISRVSMELLQDSAFDISNWVANRLGKRIGRINNQHFTTGTGTAQPQGIVTGAVAGVTAAAVAAITLDELIDLMATVDPDYLEPPDEVGWMMSQTAQTKIRKLKDADDNYLWQPSNQAGVPATLLGYPVHINNDMSAPSAGVKSVLFGNFKAGYVVRDVKDVQVLRLIERYADYGQEGYIGFSRADAVVQDPAAYRALTQAAA